MCACAIIAEWVLPSAVYSLLPDAWTRWRALQVIPFAALLFPLSLILRLSFHWSLRELLASLALGEMLVFFGVANSASYSFGGGFFISWFAVVSAFLVVPWITGTLVGAGLLALSRRRCDRTS